MSASEISRLLEQALAAHRRRDPVQVNAWVRQVLTLDPENADALYLLGISAASMNRPDLAVHLLRKAVACNPGHPYYHFNLGSCFSALGQNERAEESLRAALALKPDLAEAHINLGNLRMAQGDPAVAVACYLHAVGLNPDLTIAHYNLGVIFQEHGDHVAALERFREALRCDPDYAPAHMGVAASRLKTGEYHEGWQEYEWRFRLPTHAPRLCPVPRWEGLPPEGARLPEGLRLYVYTEQGFGDALMFARFAPLLRERGGRVLLECRPELSRLFAASSLADLVSARALDDGAPPPFDYDRHVPLMSLPGLLGITLETLPDSCPYLVAPPERVQAWGERLGEKKGWRIGLCWSGNPSTAVNRDRACTVQDLLPLTLLPGITFYSLQKGPPAAQLTRELCQRHDIVSLEAELEDFAETAAVLRNLDLLISTDTAIVHLAGGLGVPVWTLLHTACEWRWLENRATSPWYPSMRLFRQAGAGDWQELVERVRRALDDSLNLKNLL
ncbi:MAG: tetratricopeptide repeat protein [Magnetococcales bacterium]|nr:tetratricopeptide repeat protein [Magnetococcales bacterium]